MRACLVAMICLALFGGLAAGPAVAADTGSSGQTRAQLKKLRDRIQHVRSTINADSKQRKRLAKALDKAQAQVVDAQHRLDEIDKRITHDEHRIDQLTDRIKTQRDHLGGQIDRLRRQVRAAYMQGKINPMRLLLSNQSPSRIGRLLVYYRYFTDAQSHQVQDLKQALAQLGRRQKQLKTQKTKLATKRRQRAETLAQVRRSQKAQEKTIAALDARLSSHKQDLGSMRANEKKLENLLGSLGNQLKDVGPPPNVNFARLKGRLRAPVSGRVLANYHQQRAHGAMRWQGRWLAAPQGAAVHAVAPGRVVYVGYMKRYGLIIIIDNGDRYYTLFGHLSSAFCRVGDSVAAGDKIATAGHSGGHRHSGVFFQIRHGSRPLNPARWLAR